MDICPDELVDLSLELIGHDLNTRLRAASNQIQALANPVVLDAHEYGRVASPEESTGALNSGDPKSGTGDVPQQGICIVGLHNRDDEFHRYAPLGLGPAAKSSVVVVTEGGHVDSDLSTSRRELASLTWTEVAEKIDANSVILLPIGAVEAHGPHLGLNTDVIIAQAAARSAADRFAAIGRDAWIAPPIWYGVSFVGAPFAGTTPVAAEPFRAYLEWVLRGLSGIGGSDVVVINAHLEPAHFSAILDACASISVETGRLIHAVDHRASRWAERLGNGIFRRKPTRRIV